MEKEGKARVRRQQEKEIDWLKGLLTRRSRGMGELGVAGDKMKWGGEFKRYAGSISKSII